MMTNQLPEGQWIRFALMGEQPGKAHGLAGGLILTALAVRPSRRVQANSIGAAWPARRWWISPKRNMAGVMMAQRQMAFVHPFSFEFKRLAYEAVKQDAEACGRRRKLHERSSSPAKAGDPVSRDVSR